MTEEKKVNKYSTDTLYVLLLVICGMFLIVFVAFTFFKPKDSNKPLQSISIQTPEPIGEISSSIEDPEESVKKSYLKEGEDDPKEEPVKVVETKPEPVAEKKSEPKKTTPVFTKKKPSQTTTSVKKVVTPKKKLVTVKGYWIQVGSFKTRAKAQESVDDLKERGLSSRVVIKDIDGVNYYRVRIGVYETKDEAQKFCDEVKKIKGFEGSYISETTTKKYVDL